MLILERPWTRQPQVPVTLTSEARDGCLLWGLPGVGDLTQQRDIKAAYGLTNEGTVRAPQISTLGRAYGFESASLARSVLASTSTWLPTTAYTVLVRVRFGSTTGTGTAVGAVAPTASLGADRCNLDMASTTTLNFDFGGYAAGSTRISASTTMTDGQEACLVATAGPRGMEIWRDGILLASHTNAPTRVSGGSGFAVGDTYGGSGGNQRYFAVVAWSRQLPAGLCRKYSMDYLATLAPRRIPIPTPAAAATAPTITALSARLITATSAQPRISYS